MDYSGSKTSMWQILRSLNFKYKKCNDKTISHGTKWIVAMHVKYATIIVMTLDL